MEPCLSYLSYCKNEGKFYYNENETFSHFKNHSKDVITIPPNLLREFYFIKYLGSGGFGVVFKVKLKKKNELYALKIIEEPYINEIQFIGKIDHPNVLKLYSRITCGYNKTAIVMELADSTLSSYVLQNHKKLSAKTIAIFFGQICEGLNYLHLNKIFHKDIKPTNILIIGDCAKIGDLGISKIENLVTKSGSENPGGTLNFMAPEYVKGENYNPILVDIYALGKTFEKIISYLKELKSNREIEALKTISENCCHENPKLRWSLDNIKHNLKDVLNKIVDENKLIIPIKKRSPSLEEIIDQIPSDEDKKLSLQSIPSKDLINIDEPEGIFFLKAFNLYNPVTNTKSRVKYHTTTLCDGITDEEALEMLNKSFGSCDSSNLEKISFFFMSYNKLTEKTIDRLIFLLVGKKFDKLNTMEIGFHMQVLSCDKLNILFKKINEKKLNLKSFSIFLKSDKYMDDFLLTLKEFLHSQKNLEKLSIYIKYVSNSNNLEQLVDFLKNGALKNLKELSLGFEKINNEYEESKIFVPFFDGLFNGIYPNLEIFSFYLNTDLSCDRILDFFQRKDLKKLNLKQFMLGLKGYSDFYDEEDRIKEVINMKIASVSKNYLDLKLFNFKKD